MSASQGLLFTEPAIAETGLWCELADGIDPAEWAHLCRYLGNLTPEQFKKAKKRLYSYRDSLKSRLKRLFFFDQRESTGYLLFVWGTYGQCRKPLDNQFCLELD